LSERGQGINFWEWLREEELVVESCGGVIAVAEYTSDKFYCALAAAKVE